MSGWREIGILIADLVAKEPPYIQIAIGLSAAFIAVMILEGMRVSFIPRRKEQSPTISARPRNTFFRSAPANVAKLPRNPKRPQNIVKPHRAPRPTIRRAKTPETPPATPSLPQVASFGD